MASSSKEGKAAIYEWLTEIGPAVKTVLDLGVGEGTYHRLFSRKSAVLRHATWVGIEAWEPYIQKYELIDRYDVIVNKDIREVDFSTLGPIDLVFAGDVLEHISKDDAITVISNLLKIAKHIVISIPIVHYPQGEEDGNPFEVHVKDDWSHDEILETFPSVKRMWTGKVIGVYLLEV